MKETAVVTGEAIGQVSATPAALALLAEIVAGRLRRRGPRGVARVRDRDRREGGDFRGFPRIPRQEAVLRYAAAGKGHDGEPL